MESLVELIAKKRDGKRLADDEIARFIKAHADGDLADYQMTAWLMAVFFRGMDDDETVALTRAMLHSGDVLDLSDIEGAKIDKHSTGGVGDKVSIALAPLVAACGVRVPMVSGRGLGHTGGTLDKLEAIPGFSVSLDIDAFRRIVRDVGCCMIGQTARIAPADKRIYALRDVTATVESIPLIVASILSKKLAEGIDGLVLDVKVGRGAFMKNVREARALAEALVRVGTAAGKKVTALLTDMEAPIGLEIGNALETREAIELLHGRAPRDLAACTMALGIEMLLLGGATDSRAEAEAKLTRAIASGKAVDVLERMIAAQGGNSAVARDPSLLPRAEVEVPVVAASSGFVVAVDALDIGLAAVAMGAGRTRADQKVDPVVGITLQKTRGDRVAVGDVLAVLHVRSKDDAARVADRVAGAFRFAETKPPAPPLVLATIAEG